ncbi:unnamed protein product [Sphagnum balticum]
MLHYNNINLDILTETFNSYFYAKYLIKWPEYCVSLWASTGPSKPIVITPPNSPRKGRGISLQTRMARTRHRSHSRTLMPQTGTGTPAHELPRTSDRASPRFLCRSIRTIDQYSGHRDVQKVWLSAIPHRQQILLK